MRMRRTPEALRPVSRISLTLVRIRMPFSVMNMTSSLRRLIMKNVGAAEISAQAIAEGMLTLRMDGWLKVIKGIASLDHVVRETSI